MLWGRWLADSKPAKQKIYIWSPSHFRYNLCLLKQAKSLQNCFLKPKIKTLWCLLYRTVADDVLFQKHLTDLDYLDWFSRYERFCEPRYL